LRPHKLIHAPNRATSKTVLNENPKRIGRKAMRTPMTPAKNEKNVITNE